MSTFTILCVDDEHNVLSTLRTQLLRHFSDYRIELAESATEALQLLEELLAEGAVIPLVIADQIMPGMKGDELLIELHLRHPEMLKVMLTGQARAEDVGNAVNHAGLYRFITKPWTEVDLILTVTEAVRRYQQEQQLRQQQLALEQANRELIQSEQDLRTIFNNVYDAILIHDLDGIILDANDRALEVRGATRSQLIGASIADLSAPDAPLERLPEMLERVRAGETLRLEWRERRFNDQCLFDVELSLRQATLNNHSVLISGMRDISDRKRVELALQQLNQDLERRVQERTLELQKAIQVAEAASQAKSSFLANMSHELRTPLNAILGFAQLMARDYKLEHEQRQQLHVINRNGEHLLRLINDILEMSKIEAGYVTFTPTCFNLYHLLNSLKEVFQLRATEKKLEFIIKTSSELPRYVKTDESKLRQILINLVGNAIKFTSKGFITLQVSVVDQSTLSQSCKPERDRQTATTSLQSSDCIFLAFNVEDTGLGIDPRELENLFEPFTQSEYQPLSHEGTGLGLTISRQFIQLMGGNLTVQSVPGVGSIFSFVIPVQLSESVNLRSLRSCSILDKPTLSEA